MSTVTRAFISTDTDDAVINLKYYRSHPRDQDVAAWAAYRLYDILNTHGLVLEMKIGDGVWRTSVRNGIIQTPQALDEHDVSWLDENVSLLTKAPFVLNANVEDFGAPHKSLAELDYIALYHSSMIGELDANGEQRQADLSNVEVADWGFQWINTQGLENKGNLILKPKDRRSKQLAVVGKAYWLMERYRLDKETAMALVRASWGIPRAFDPRVIELVIEGLPFAGVKDLDPDAVDAFLITGGIDHPDVEPLSAIQKDAIYRMLKEYDIKRRDPNDAPAFPEHLLDQAIERRSVPIGLTDA